MESAVALFLLLIGVIALAGIVRAILMFKSRGSMEYIQQRLDRIERQLARLAEATADKKAAPRYSGRNHDAEPEKAKTRYPHSDAACTAMSGDTLVSGLQPEPPQSEFETIVLSEPPAKPSASKPWEEIAPVIGMVGKTRVEQVHRNTMCPEPENEVKAVLDNDRFEAASTADESRYFEQKAGEILNHIWMWFVVGDDYRRQDISREYAVASTWLIRLAIIILLAGSTFFLKYSIEKGLMPPALRVCFSTLSALAMLGGGIVLAGKDKKYDLLGRGLAGGGIALLYFSVFAATAMYHLLGPFPGFLLMVLITATAWSVSVVKNIMLMAILGILGGYLTPVLLSTGQKNLYGLFGYMLLLGFGTLGISRYRDWKLLNGLSFLATYAIFLLALREFYQTSTDYPPTMIFLVCYFVLFSAMALTFNIRNRKKSTILELYALLFNTVIFLGVSWFYTVKHYDRAWMACYSLGAAAFFSMHIVWFLRQRFRDRNLILMLFGFAVFCLSLTFPLALSGVWISASWATLAVILLYLALRIGSKALLVSSYLLYFASAWRVFIMDYAGMPRRLGNVYWQGLLDHLLSGGVLCLALIVGYRLLARHGDAMPRGVVAESNDLPIHASPRQTGTAFLWASAVVAFVLLNIEIPNFALTVYPSLSEPLAALVWSCMLLFLCHMAIRESSRKLFNIALAFAIILLIKLFTLDLGAWHFSFSNNAFGSSFLMTATILRTIAFCIVFTAMLTGMKKLSVYENAPSRQSFGLLALIQLFIFLTLEISSTFYHFLPDFRAGGVSILWGLFAFALIADGIRRRNRGMRIAGLSLFAVDVVKIFLWDLDDLSQFYRIVAFIVLGLVFLAGGFIYIKCREQFNVAEQPESRKPQEDMS